MDFNQKLNLTVKQFADHYIPCNSKIRVIKNCEKN